MLSVPDEASDADGKAAKELCARLGQVRVRVRVVRLGSAGLESGVRTVTNPNPNPNRTRTRTRPVGESPGRASPCGLLDRRQRHRVWRTTPPPPPPPPAATRGRHRTRAHMPAWPSRLRIHAVCAVIHARSPIPAHMRMPAARVTWARAPGQDATANPNPNPNPNAGGRSGGIQARALGHQAALALSPSDTGERRSPRRPQP